MFLSTFLGRQKLKNYVNVQNLGGLRPVTVPLPNKEHTTVNGMMTVPLPNKEHTTVHGITVWRPCHSLTKSMCTVWRLCHSLTKSSDASGFVGPFHPLTKGPFHSLTEGSALEGVVGPGDLAGVAGRSTP